jgi:type I restriction enzyme S subunit
VKAVEGWSSFAVEQCCDILDSMRVPVNAEDRDKRIGEIPYYGANGLQGYIDDFIFDEPLILIAEDGGCFDEFATRPIAYRIKGKSWVNNHAHVLRAKETFCQDAVFYNLEHKDIQSFIVGGTRSKLNQVALRAITLTLPTSKPEQTKIAEILLTVDRAIEQTEALIAKQQRIKTGLMQDLLTRGIDEHGNLRSEQTHKFKDSPLGRIPVEWEVKPLGQVSNLITNGFVGVATPHYTESSEGIPYLYGNNIRNNYVDLTKVTLINRSFHSKQHKSQLQPGDMLTVQSGHIGTTAVVPDSLSESNCHALIITKFKKELLSPDFVSLYCNFCLETGSMSHLFIGSTIKHINTSDFAKFAIPFPPKDEQFQIAHRLLDLSNTVNVAGAKLTKLRALKTALMQDLLTGKKRVAGLLNDTEVSKMIQEKTPQQAKVARNLCRTQ